MTDRDDIYSDNPSTEARQQFKNRRLEQAKEIVTTDSREIAFRAIDKMINQVNLQIMNQIMGMNTGEDPYDHRTLRATLEMLEDTRKNVELGAYQSCDCCNEKPEAGIL